MKSLAPRPIPHSVTLGSTLRPVPHSIAPIPLAFWKAGLMSARMSMAAYVWLKGHLVR